MMSKLRCACVVSLFTVLGFMQPAAVEAAEVTILVNGSFNAYPEWMNDWSAEFTAIADTYGAPPIQFRWLDNDAVTAAHAYSGIFNGGYALAIFINSLGLAPEDNLNVVAHSHGGNVALIASYYTSYLARPYRHLINLGTPINLDLYQLGGYGAYSHCQVSSYTDWTQFWGAAPWQWVGFFDNQYWAGVYVAEALQAAYYEDWESFGYFMALAAFHEAEAQVWWFSTKYEFGAVNKFVWDGESHSDLHEPPVWYDIRNDCAWS